MATLKDSFEPGSGQNELSAYLGGTRRYCQTFLAGSNYDVSQVAFYMWKQNANDANVFYCYLYALDGSNKPTGSALASGQITLASVPNGIGSKDWVTIAFASSYSLTSGTSYGLVTYCPDADYTDVAVQVDSNVKYTNGLQWYSSDGTNWADNSRDQYFRTYEESFTYVDVSANIDGSGDITGTASVSDVIDASAGLSGSGSIVGTSSLTTYIDVSASIIGAGSIIGTSTKTLEWQNENFISVRRLVVAGNDSIWYEDV